MVKFKPKKEEGSLEFKLQQKLNNFNPEEVESYLELMLKKCLEATIQKDYLTLGSVEDILNKSVVILASKVKNFSLMYTNVKLKVATEYLAKFIELDNTEAFKFFNVLPEFTTLEEAEKILEVEDYDYFKWAKNHVLGTSYIELFENDKYTIIFDSDYIIALDKETKDKVASFETWDGNLEVLEAFINNRNELKPNETLEVISIMNDIKGSEKNIKLEQMYNYIMEFYFNNTYFKFSEANILYFKENPNFIVLVDVEYIIFIYDKKTGRYNTFCNPMFNLKDNLFNFLDYCLGAEKEEVKVPEAKVIEVYNVFLKILVEGYNDLKQLIKYYNENPSDKIYNLINSYFFSNQKKIQLIKYLLEEPVIADNVEPEVMKNIHYNFKDYNSLSSEVLEIAKHYNRKHKEEDSERMNSYIQKNKEYEESLRSLGIF